MSLIKFSQEVENRILQEIRDAYPANWDEDYITRRITVALASLNGTQVEYLTKFQNIFIAAFKQKGKAETNYGDLAIVVDITYADGDNLVGVAFLEAKRRYEKTTEYKKLDFVQLQRIYDNAPSARLLLYNYKPMSELAPTGLDGGNVSSGGSGLLPKLPSTYTSVMPANTAIHLKKKDDSIEKFSIPFSYQLAFRYLFGMELEFDKEKVDAALGNAKNEEDIPLYVIPITVKPGKKGDKLKEVNYSPAVNKEVFAEIRDLSDFE